ncbi:MAG: hypothetical protein ACI4AK_03740 [Lepagella sp.]
MEKEITTYSSEPLRDERLLQRAIESYGALLPYRKERERCKRFTYGDQWIDSVVGHGVKISEEEYIKRQGNMPLKNNLIRRLVRNVLGVWRNRSQTPRIRWRDEAEAAQGELLTRILKKNMEENRLEEVYARSMEEFLIGGMVVHKKWYGKKGGMQTCHTDMVDLNNFFVERSGRDFRGDDITLIGEIHHLTIDRLLSTLTRHPGDRQRIRRLYGVAPGTEEDVTCTIYEIWDRRSVDLLSCHDRAKGIYYQVSADSYPEIEAENERRRRGGIPGIEIRYSAHEVWRLSIMDEAGRVLQRSRTPYRHQSHPYVVKAYPYIDGEIHSFVSDIIDQQKLTNRLISMYDWVLRASAKGVLLFPEGSLPDGVDITDIAEEWGRFNGVIVYRPRSGVPLPQQVSSKSTDIGITELLEIQMKMMEDISGVNGALQGKLDNNSMSGTLYNQQTQNSLTALADLMSSYEDFVTAATRKDMDNLQQFLVGNG